MLILVTIKPMLTQNFSRFFTIRFFSFKIIDYFLSLHRLAWFYSLNRNIVFKRFYLNGRWNLHIALLFYIII
jgi:hypothetical protein